MATGTGITADDANHDIAQVLYDFEHAVTDEKGTFTATEVRDLLATNAIKRINDRTVARIVDMVNWNSLRVLYGR